MSWNHTFLPDLIAKQETVAIFLTNGVRLNGLIDHIEPSTHSWKNGFLLLTLSGRTQLVMLHAIATISVRP